MKRYPEMTYREVLEIADEKNDQGYLKDWARENFYAPGDFDYDLMKVARKEVIYMLRDGRGFDHDEPGHVVARQMTQYMADNRARYEAQIN